MLYSSCGKISASWDTKKKRNWDVGMLGWFRSPVTPPEYPEWDDDVLSEFLSKQRVGNVRFLAFLNISYPLVLLDHVKNQYTYQPLSWHDLTDTSWEFKSWQSLWIEHSFLRCPDRFANWTDRRAKEISRYEAVSTVLNSASQDRSRWILYDPITTWRDHFFNLFIFATW